MSDSNISPDGANGRTVQSTNYGTGDGSSHFRDPDPQKYDLHGAGPREYSKTWPDTVTNVTGIVPVKEGS